MSSATAVRETSTAPAATTTGGGPGRPRVGARYAVLVALIGILVTGVFGYRVQHKLGVYWAQVNVLFVPPVSGVYPNALANTPGALINVAGVVGKVVDPGASGPRVVSPDVTLANQGIRHGYAVTLPNSGGQWADNFTKALLDVQAVGSSGDEVTRTVDGLIGKINATLQSLQDSANVDSRNRIHTALNPSRVQIYYDAGRRTRAVAVTVGLSLVLTVVAATFALRWGHRKVS